MATTGELGSTGSFIPERDTPPARLSLLRGTFALSQTVWNLPDRKTGDRPAHCPWNPDPDATPDPNAPPPPIFIIEPRAVLHCLRFDGAGKISGRVRLNSRYGTRDAELNGTYALRKNFALDVTDGFMTVNIPDFGAVNQLYLVRRSPDEIDLLMFQSNAVGSVQPVLGGTLKRVRRAWADWINWWPF